VIAALYRKVDFVTAAPVLRRSSWDLWSSIETMLSQDRPSSSDGPLRTRPFGHDRSLIGHRRHPPELAASLTWDTDLAQGALRA
jgi:hypothetical protein